MKLVGLHVLPLLAYGQYNPNFAPGHAGIIHLFEWHWDTIANECETFLGPKGVGGVQISPPHENRIIDGRPWWERYQPISYKFSTRSGDQDALQDMINRCNAVGVRIYADVVPNHMCGAGGTGTGTGGTYFNANTEQFEGVPYSSLDFNDANCYSSSGDIENYQDPNQVRNCRLVSLLDLNQGKSYVREQITNMMNELIAMGVAGFRVDACKHMWPNDLDAMFNGMLDNVIDELGGGKPYIVQEVIDQGGEPITADQYFGTGQVTNFIYGLKVAENIQQIKYLETIGQSWGMMPDRYSLTFLNNHDNQRGHGGGGKLLTFWQHYDLKIATAFMMAHPYGEPRVMSSFFFEDSDDGPPDQQPTVKSVNATVCENGWVCEHRWSAMQPMYLFRAAVKNTGINDWWDNGGNQIAFGRGDKGFIVINKDSSTVSRTFQTGVPPGTYQDVFSGKTVTVDASRQVSVTLSNEEDNNIFAIHVPVGTGNDNPDDSNTDSCQVGIKTDCGFLGIDEVGCQQKGCCWVPDYQGSDPWCFYSNDS